MGQKIKNQIWQSTSELTSLCRRSSGLGVDSFELFPGTTGKQLSKSTLTNARGAAHRDAKLNSRLDQENSGFSTE